MGSVKAHLCFIIGLSLLASGITAQGGISEIIQNSADCNFKIDLIIVVDGSDSVQSSNFLIIKDWIKDLANGFKIDSGNVLIGVVQYSYWYRRRPMWRQRYIKTEIPLGKYKTYRDFSGAVDRIRYQGYQTFTAHAINKTVDYDFQSRNSRYPEAQRAIILLTDGHATDAKDLPGAIDHAEKDAGVVIFAVGVGEYSIDELKIITRNDQRRIFELRNFNELTNIVYELPNLLQKACDCNLVGSVNNECDTCTRQCTCKPNVVGRRCDACAPGYYKFTETGCIPCQCNSLGVSEDDKCDKNTGRCICRPNVVGEQCDECQVGRFHFPDCVQCDCNGFSTSCSTDGKCLKCFGNRAGDNCETCRSGYYMSTSSLCVPCECNGRIDKEDPDSCDAKTGECLKCLNGYGGSKCEECAEYYFKNATDASCTKCLCNPGGTVVENCNDDSCTCDQESGRCTCKANVVGKTCDSCADGFWNLREKAGCEACGCHGQGSLSNVCDKITGKCECQPGHSGTKCEICDHGHSKLNKEDACRPCDCNLSGTIKSSCVNGTCSCDATKCSCLPNVVGKSCSECEKAYYGFGLEEGCKSCDCNPIGSLSQVCDTESGVCECLPGHKGTKCENCDDGFYRTSEQNLCIACDCNLSGTNKSTCNNDTCLCDATSGQCSCISNVVGKSCDKCADGYWGYGCRSCGCNAEGSLSQSCGASTGICECLPGYIGSKCDLCDEGYYWASELLCKECACNKNGTDISSCEGDICNCESYTGQCTCNANVIGESCDTCADGFWNLNKESGCESCGCHGKGSASSICDKVTGKCECIVGNTGTKCQNCNYGYSKNLSKEDACTFCHCNLTGTVPGSCNGERCWCDAYTGQCPCIRNVVGKLCNGCADTYWGFGSGDGCRSCECNAAGSISQSCGADNGVCECLPGYTGTKCDSCDVGYYKTSEQLCKECGCNKNGTDISTCKGDSCHCDQSTAQCTCSANVIGKSCDTCSDGFWNLGKESGCEACGCHAKGSTSSLCDKTTGQCECLPGHTGIKCEQCEYGYSKSNEEDACTLCDCNVSGTISSSCKNGTCSCDATSGQCPCLPNVVGKSCNECAYGHWDFRSGVGCKKCGCDKSGSLSPTCDATTGVCECLPGHTGIKCDGCDKGFYQDENKLCKACECVRSGTQESTCEEDSCMCESVTGQCSCLPNVVGASCNKCAENHWGFGSEDGCMHCDCDESGSNFTSCDVITGSCECVTGYSGTKCNTCDSGYFQNQDGTCQKCECSKEGTNSSSCSEKGCECNQFTGQCSCITSVVGKSCNTCDDGFWNLQPDRGCEECRCNELGSNSSVCNKDSGECECQAGYSRMKCDECNSGYTKSKEDEACELCRCDATGTEKSECLEGMCACDVTTGQCPCKLNVIGRYCSECKDLHWGFDTAEGCRACDCNIQGSLSASCDENTGKCECLPRFAGDKCEKCARGYFGDSCEKCECDLFGTEFSECADVDSCSCDSVSGQCSCYPNVVGKSCNECADGFWNLESGDGCESCGCHARGSVTKICDKQTGHCECMPGYTGEKCETCEHGHSKEDGDSCTACDCNLSGTNSSTCDVGSCSCDSITGQCSCLPNVAGVSCDTCEDGYWDFGVENGCRLCDCHTMGSISQTCNKKSGKCECLPGHAGNKCDLCAAGYSRKYPKAKCKACRCDPLGTVGSSLVDGVYGCEPLSGQCTCLPNVVGLSCDKCGDGFWDLASKKGCEPCGCAAGGSLSSVCDKLTGSCKCRPGHVGIKCEKCKIGFFRKNPSEQCQECKCNMYGRKASTCVGDKCACDPYSGRCNCLPHVTGMTCDRCEDGFWDLRSMQGCKPCGCHVRGSYSRICEKKTGECECIPGNGGKRCDKCDKEYAKLNPWEKCKSTTISDEGTNKTYTTKKTKDIKKPTSPSPTSPSPTWRPYRPSTRYVTRPPNRYVTAGCQSCGRKWPSYCHGWMCRRRWPHQKFTPSPKRCNYGHTSCQYNVATMYGKAYGKKKAKVRPTTPPKQRSSRPNYGFRLYGNSNYYIPYQRPRTYTRSRSYSSSHRPRSYGLYRSLYGRWN